MNRLFLLLLTGLSLVYAETVSPSIEKELTRIEVGKKGFYEFINQARQDPEIASVLLSPDQFENLVIKIETHWADFQSANGKKERPLPAQVIMGIDQALQKAHGHPYRLGTLIDMNTIVDSIETVGRNESDPNGFREFQSLNQTFKWHVKAVMETADVYLGLERSHPPLTAPVK